MNEIITERLPLGEVDQRRCDELAIERCCKPSELEFIRKGFVSESKGMDSEERSSIELISTANTDRDNEILLPKGAMLQHYKKNPQVLWAHDYRMPPIGRSAWVKKDSTKQGLLAKTIYATTEFAEEIWSLIKGGFLPARSVGFIPIESHEPDDRELAKHPEYIGARRIYDKWELLEYSVVPVPSNREALQMACSKDISLSIELQKQLGLDMNEAFINEVEKGRLERIGREKAIYDCECIKCGYSMSSDKHCKDLACPECGGQMRRAERPGPGQELFEIEESKPYPQEHSCRLKSPDLYKTCRRTSRTSDGKKYSVLTCQRKDDASKWEEQAYRYDKEVWTATQARAHCKEHDGTFEAAKQPTELISLPSKVKSVIMVPQVRQVVFVPKNVLDIRKKVVTVVREELERAKGRV